jgi:predicted MFS family arabinose efflux permease
VPRFLRAIYGGLPRRVWWLALGVFVNRAGFFAVPMLLVFLTRERGLAADEAGALLALYAAGALAAAAGGGWMSDALGRRPTMLVSLFGASLLWLAVFLARPLGLLAVLLFATGAAADLYRSAAASMIADLCGAAQRPRAYALSRMAANAGMALGPALAGFLAERSFLLVFAGESATSLLFGLVILLRLPESRPGAVEQVRALRGLRQVASDRLFLLLCFANLCVVSVYMQQLSTLPLYVVEHLGLSLVDQGFLLSINGGGIVLFEMLIVARTRRMRPLFAIALGSALMGLGFGGLGLAHDFAGLAACVGLWTLGEMVAWPILPNWVVSRAPEALRGRYLGFTGVSTGLALLLGAAGGTRLARERGFDVLWTVCLAVCLGAALLVLALGVFERTRARRGA